MVDAVVSFAVNKLGDALIREADFLFGIRSQVQELHDELRRMQCFLQDADAKEQGDSRVRNWVEEIRNLAHDAEDVIDTFILEVDSTRKTNFLTKAFSMVNNSGNLHKVGKAIQAIQDRLKAISASRITYGIKDLQGNEASSSETNQRMINQHPLRNRYPHEEDFHVIGFEEHTKILLAELMKDGEEGRRCIISVVGVGGLGKTTLAKKIYRHDTVKSRFDCCGWSSVSQQLNVKDVLGEIMKKCMSLPDSDLQKMNEEDRMEKLYNYLQDKRYFVVLDDVWKINHWSTLIHAFPIGRRGSKVLLTTRNKEVAAHADPHSLHFEPRYLNDEESWELLCKKALPMAGVNCCPAELVKLGREMVRKCGGLPLAVCVLGGLLGTKRSEIKQWELVHKNVVSNINRGEYGGVNAILALSYHDLPTYLKPCFLYLGVFPEDYEIPRRKLIQLWIAEGFISDQEENTSTMEDIGKHQYLAELNQRCMIQINKGIYGGNTCRVHDLMRDLCLLKAKEINFLNIYDMQHPTGDIEASHPRATDACKVRRYATHLIHADPSKRYNINFNIPNCALRTFTVFCPYDFPLKPIKYRNIKLLRVLDLGNVGRKYRSGSTTKEVSRLIHLKYLDLGNLSGVPVSSSIGNLRNLQMLRLIRYEGNLPETTSKLVQLRHLELNCGSVDRKFRIENLINLHTLEGIRAGEWIRKGCFEELSNLRRLSVESASPLQIEIILDEVVGKRSSPASSSSSSRSDDQHQNPIRSLSLSSFYKGSFPNSIFDSLSSCHNLRSLNLKGRLDIANLQNYPPNLTKLHLFGSVFTEDPMATLQHLPKLCILDLKFCEYEGKEMVCSSKGFPQLQFLEIHDSQVEEMVRMPHLKEWRVDQGGMPRLKELSLLSLKLSMLPEGLQFITTLEKLEMFNMPWMKERVAEGVGADWYKVQHIPTITVHGY